MGNLKFSFLVSLVFLSNLLLNPIILILTPIMLLQGSKIDQSFINQITFQLILYFVSVSLVYINLSLASNKNEIVKYTSLIFGLPILIGILGGIWLVFDTYKFTKESSGSYGYSEGMLAVGIGVPILIFFIGVSVFYFLTIRKRIFNQLQGI